MNLTFKLSDTRVVKVTEIQYAPGSVGEGTWTAWCQRCDGTMFSGEGRTLALALSELAFAYDPEAFK